MSRRVIKRGTVDASSKEEIEQKNQEKMRDLYINADHPNTMENGPATFLWIVAMIVSLLFNGGWILCILETVVWWKFVNRKAYRAKEWDEKHKK